VEDGEKEKRLIEYRIHYKFHSGYYPQFVWKIRYIEKNGRKWKWEKRGRQKYYECRIVV
jgi:hypothetical protein